MKPDKYNLFSRTSADFRIGFILEGDFRAYEHLIYVKAKSADAEPVLSITGIATGTEPYAETTISFVVDAADLEEIAPGQYVWEWRINGSGSDVYVEGVWTHEQGTVWGLLGD
jgi:hypothetical protein